MRCMTAEARPFMCGVRAVAAAIQAAAYRTAEEIKTAAGVYYGYGEVPSVAPE